jgi:hypothetical protein
MKKTKKELKGHFSLQETMNRRDIPTGPTIVTQTPESLGECAWFLDSE